MTEIPITRTKIIVVSETGINSYGDLMFTDKEGGQYKISSKRKAQFAEIILPGRGVELNYGVYKNNEYIVSAGLIGDLLPAQPAKVPPAAPAAPLTQVKTETTVTDWAARDRITRKSIERQTSLNAAVEIAKILGGDNLESGKILAIAKKFEAYLAGEEPGKSRLVEQAKAMGATETKE